MFVEATSKDDAEFALLKAQDNGSELAELKHKVHDRK